MTAYLSGYGSANPYKHWVCGLLKAVKALKVLKALEVSKNFKVKDHFQPLEILKWFASLTHVLGPYSGGSAPNACGVGSRLGEEGLDVCQGKHLGPGNQVLDALGARYGDPRRV